MEYHVAKSGSNSGKGTAREPFLTINKAAAAAMAGDTIIVHEGVYREWVNPKFKGLSNKRRITYKAADGEKVVIKGSEQISSWQRTEANVWKVVLPNEYFGDYNPYAVSIFGDWLLESDSVRHVGDVYLNGMSFYEVGNYQALLEPETRTEIKDDWTGEMVLVLNPEQTKYVWYAEVGEENTTIYANFQGADPNAELTEINVRRSCFFPKENGIDYITVRGFEMAQAATPWTPPTADQPGLIGPNWSKGWIIEDNIIHDAKCSAISIGKEATTGNNYCSVRRDKPGYQYQLEAVFSAERAGWSREKIGSHIIRGNTIHDCGQNGIVGHLGGVFSEIYDNHIYNIALKREFYGYEIAGIKLHAAIDVRIHNNRIHNCSLGVWLDWEAQGTRVSKNLFYRNNRDLFVEVSHGPYMIDNNILASRHSIDNASQGGAYINNLICGKMVQWKEETRSTQYHLPHSTKVAGFTLIYGGDDRFYNNIFIGTKDQEGVGTAHYNDYTTSLEQYMEMVAKKTGDLEVFRQVNQPVYINNNVYYAGAQPFDKEDTNVVDEAFQPNLQVTIQGDAVSVSCRLPEDFEAFTAAVKSTATLPRVRIADADFENPDGSDLVLDTDYFGVKREEMSVPGPIAAFRGGENHLKVW